MLSKDAFIKAAAPYGYRIEGCGHIEDYFDNPFYFSHMRPLDIEAAPHLEGHVGVWFFTSVEEALLLRGVAAERFVSRFNLAALGDERFTFDPRMDDAGIVVRRLSSQRQNGEQFAKNQVLPDDVIDVWDGQSWVTKAHVKDRGMKIRKDVLAKTYRYPVHEIDPSHRHAPTLKRIYKIS